MQYFGRNVAFKQKHSGHATPFCRKMAAMDQAYLPVIVAQVPTTAHSLILPSWAAVQRGEINDQSKNSPTPTSQDAKQKLLRKILSANTKGKILSYSWQCIKSGYDYRYSIHVLVSIPLICTYTSIGFHDQRTFKKKEFLY